MSLMFNYYTSQLTSQKNLLQIERSRNSKHTSALQDGRICLPPIIKNFLTDMQGNGNFERTARIESSQVLDDKIL